MTTTFTDLELNAQADFEAGRCLFASLHVADPTTVGDKEATGGSPAYARQPLTFSAAGVQGPLGGAQPATPGIAWCDQVIFDVPAASYGWIGLWGIVTGGDAGSSQLRATKALPTPVVMTGQGQLAFAFGVGPAAEA
jgi:hypothetical protein